MRKIMFRVWNEEDRLMYGPWSIVDVSLFSARVFNTNPATGARLKWSQYTGLKDKNGKDIYEGDIVSWTRYENQVVSGPVSWMEYKWAVLGYQHGTAETDYLTEFLAGNYYSVIGNIYENKNTEESMNQTMMIHRVKSICLGEITKGKPEGGDEYNVREILIIGEGGEITINLFADDPKSLRIIHTKED